MKNKINLNEEEYEYLVEALQEDFDEYLVDEKKLEPLFEHNDFLRIAIIEIDDNLTDDEELWGLWETNEHVVNFSGLESEEIMFLYRVEKKVELVPTTIYKRIEDV